MIRIAYFLLFVWCVIPQTDAMATSAARAASRQIIGWKEEVRLHDGTVITVDLKHSYEHRGSLALLRDTELTFDSGGPAGRITQVFRGFHPLMLDKFQGNWYVVIYGGHYYQTKTEPGQDWGPHRYECYPVALLRGRNFVPLPLEELPKEFTHSNMLILNAPLSEISKLDSKHISIELKAEWKRRHPPGIGQNKLCKAPAPKK